LGLLLRIPRLDPASQSLVFAFPVTVGVLTHRDWKSQRLNPGEARPRLRKNALESESETMALCGADFV
jgi:hypothetical protein